MKLQYFLDTDTVIYIKNHRPPQVLKPGVVGMSVITYGELIRGAERSDFKQRNHQKLKQIIEIIPVLSMPKDTELYYGEIHSDLEKSGSIIGNNYLWIAASCKSYEGYYCY